MATIGDLKVLITADNRDLKGKLDESKKVVEEKTGDMARTGEQKGGDLGKLFSAAAWAALAKLGVEIAQWANNVFTQYDNQLDRLRYSYQDMEGISSAAMTANKMTAAGFEKVAGAAGVIIGRLGRDASDANVVRLIAQMAKLQDEAGLSTNALQEMATVAQRFGMTNQLGSVFGYVLAAADKSRFGIEETAKALADAAPLAQMLGFDMQYLATVAQKLGNKGYSIGDWAGVMNTKMTSLGATTEEVAQGWADMVKQIATTKDRTQGVLKLVSYGFRESMAGTLYDIIRSGGFDKSKLVTAAPLPTLTPEDYQELWGITVKKLEDAVFRLVTALDKSLMQNAPDAKQSPLPSLKLQQTHEWQQWVDLLTMEQQRKLQQNLLPDIPQTVDELKKAIELLQPQKKSSLVFEMPKAIGQGAMMGGIQADWMDSTAFMVNEMYNVQDEAVGAFHVVQAEGSKAASGIARSWDYNFGAMRYVSGEFATVISGNTEKAVWNLHTAFGVIGIDVTEIQAKLADWGINVPVLFDNLLAGAKRVGNELLSNMGLSDTMEKLKGWLDETQKTLQAMGINIGTYWELLMSDTAYTMDEIGKTATDRLQKLAGTAVMMLAEMFATGKPKLAQLWQKIWGSLLDIAIQAVIKIVTTETLMLSTMAAIETGIAILTGQYGKLATIGIVVAGVLSTVAGLTALIYGVGKVAEWADDKLSPTTPAPINPNSGGGAGVSSVIIQNPTFIGTIDDRSAQAVGEGFARSLSIRGAVPQPIS